MDIFDLKNMVVPVSPVSGGVKSQTKQKGNESAVIIYLYYDRSRIDRFGNYRSDKGHY